MSGTTEIQWTATYNADGTVTPGRTWNPTVGCDRVSAGCKNCYAFKLHDMRHAAKLAGKALPDQYLKPFTEIQLFPNRLREPLSWKKPGKVFVNSVSDLFHDDVPFDFIDQVFAVMALTPHLTYQVLTKRPQRMLEYFTAKRMMASPSLPASDSTQWHIWAACGGFGHKADAPWVWVNAGGKISGPWPLPNVWLGVSVENQRAADERIGLLLQVPAAVRFISGEPLLGALDLRPWLGISQFEEGAPWARDTGADLDWVIVGGESGPGARPMHPDWARSLRDQCAAARVPFFFKQNGEFLHNGEPSDWCRQTFNRVGKKAAGRLLDGREWNDYPEVR